MKRTLKVVYVIFCSALFVGIMCSVWIGLIRPELPDRAAGYSALSEVIRVDSSEVSDLRYDYDSPGFHGDDGHYFRFKYQDDEWIEVLIGRLGAVRLSRTASGLELQNASWWDFSEAKDIESYTFDRAPYQSKFLWIDRQRKLVYVNVWNS